MKLRRYSNIETPLIIFIRFLSNLFAEDQIIINSLMELFLNLIYIITLKSNKIINTLNLSMKDEKSYYSQAA